MKAFDPNDARAVTVTLHRSARQRMDRLTDELAEVNEVWFRDMTPAEIHQFSKYIERVLNCFDDAYEKASDKFRSPLNRSGDLI